MRKKRNAIIKDLDDNIAKCEENELRSLRVSVDILAHSLKTVNPVSWQATIIGLDHTSLSSGQCVVKARQTMPDPYQRKLPAIGDRNEAKHPKCLKIGNRAPTDRLWLINK